MRFFHAQTNYETIREDFWEREDDERERQVDMHGRDAWYPIDSHEISADAQDAALAEYLEGLKTVADADAALADFLLPPSFRSKVEKRRAAIRLSAFSSTEHAAHHKIA